ncbi:MAG: hypothetical protein HZB26_24735 [Candidatus Hydrogenedentes bacterium]|nr:hypothetical protein [Candidatus Hydrogenedentota bacterium]
MNTGAYYKYRTLKSDQAKAYCSVEAVLLDVRTGIVPFTSAAVAEFLAQKDKDSFTFSEAVDAAEQEAAGKALLEVAGDLTKFLNALP